MSIIINLIWFAIILGVIVFVHEFGHFIWAKKFGVYVHEFAIGMGPKIIGKRIGETEYTLRCLPLGGFCSIAGEDGEETDEKGKKIPKKRKLYAKPIWQRAIVLVAGIVNNFILALVFLFLIGVFVGSPNMDPVVRELTPDYPIEEAGIVEGDKILKVNGHRTKTIEDVQVRIMVMEKGSDLKLQIEHKDGSTEDYTIVPKKEVKDGETNYYYGIVFKTEFDHGFINAIKYSFNKFGALIRQMIMVLGMLFSGTGLDKLSGPVGIYSTVGEARSYGFATLVQLTALLSINVGFINLLPFPAFDGGRLFLLLIEKIRGKALDPKIEGMINLVGFILIILLSLYVTKNDIIRLITGK